MKKYVILGLALLLAATPAFALLSAGQIWKLNNRMGKVASEVQLGTLIRSIEGVTLGSLADGTVWVGNGAAVATPVTLSGDFTITNAGVSTIANDAITSAKILSNEIVNADINSAAAIAYSKLAALASGNILVGSAGNVAASVNPSGDIDVTNAGLFSIAADSIVNADIKTDAAIAWSKMAALTAAHVLVGSAGGVATDVAVSGVITMSNAGATAFAASVVDAAAIATDAVDAAEIKAGAVGKAELATAVLPSHVVKFAGSTASENDGDSSVVGTAGVYVGIAATDFVSCTIRAQAGTAYIKACVPSADTITVTLSGNGGVGTVIDYVVVRAVP